MPQTIRSGTERGPEPPRIRDCATTREATRPPPGLRLLLEEDPGEAENQDHEEHEEQNLDPDGEPHQPSRLARPLPADLAVGGARRQGRLAAVAVGLFHGSCHVWSMPNRRSLYSSERGRGDRSAQ